MLATIAGFLSSTAARWVLGGTFGAMLIAGGLIWFNMNFVSKAEMLSWKSRAEHLEQAIEYQKKLMEQYDSQRSEAEEKVQELEKQNDEQTATEREGDNPVLLDRTDAERLREFQKRLK